MLVACVFEEWRTDIPYNRAKVIAKSSDNWFFEPVTDPEGEFPTTGDISISRAYIPDNMKQFRAGIWEVTKAPSGGYRKCEYWAIRFHKNLVDIITIDCFSHQHDLVRETLKNGISLTFPVHGEVYIEFLDGVVIGPVSIKTSEEANIFTFYCEDEAFHIPFNAWKDKDSLGYLVYQNSFNNKPRHFIATSTPPEKEFLIDMAPIKLAMTSVLRFACKKGPGKYYISKKEQDEIASRLTSLGETPEHIAARVSKVLSFLDNSYEVGDKIYTRLDALLELPEIQQELQELKETIVKEEKEKLMEQEQELIDKIDNLELEKKCLEEKIVEIRNEIKETRRQLVIVGEQTANHIEETIKNAINNSHEVLAQVALLKPFIGNEYSQELEAKKIKIDPVEVLSGYRHIIDKLLDNFTNIGMIKKDAQIFAHEVYAAITSGQWVFLRGSISAIVAEAIAKTINSENNYTVTVPVGFEGSAEFTRLFTNLQIETSPAILTLINANNSCLNSYASMIIEFIKERTFYEANVTPIIIGTLSDSPCSIDDFELFTSIGPVFDVDCLKIKRKKGLRLLPTKVSELEPIEVSASPKYPEELEILIEQCNIRKPSNLWTVGVQVAYEKISHILAETDSPLNPIHSILYGWIVPRIVQCGVNIDEYFEFIKNSGMGNTDQRLVRLLKDYVGGSNDD